MRIGQGLRTGLGHGGITCVLQTQFSSLFFFCGGGQKSCSDGLGHMNIMATMPIYGKNLKKSSV